MSKYAVTAERRAGERRHQGGRLSAHRERRVRERRLPVQHQSVQFDDGSSVLLIDVWRGFDKASRRMFLASEGVSEALAKKRFSKLPWPLRQKFKWTVNKLVEDIEAQSEAQPAHAWSFHPLIERGHETQGAVYKPIANPYLVREEYDADFNRACQLYLEFTEALQAGGPTNDGDFRERYWRRLLDKYGSRQQALPRYRYVLWNLMCAITQAGTEGDMAGLGELMLRSASQARADTQ